MDRRTGLVGLVGAALWVGSGLMSCGGPDPRARAEPPLEVEDVGPGIEVDTTGDVREVRRSGGLTGVLPEGFPNDLPLSLPASIVDFESSRSVTLLTAEPRSRVESDLVGRWKAEGWAVSSVGAGRFEGEREGRRAHLQVEDAAPGTRYRWSW